MSTQVWGTILLLWSNGWWFQATEFHQKLFPRLGVKFCALMFWWPVTKLWIVVKVSLSLFRSRKCLEPRESKLALPFPWYLGLLASILLPLPWYLGLLASIPWKLSWCRFRSTFRWNAFGQSEQVNGLYPVCLRVWVIKLLDWENDLPQTTHLCGFSPVWVYVCFFMSDFWWNLFPQ